MIHKVIIENFKSLRSVNIDLEPFTVFVGANGSGKSSILQAVDLLCESFQGPKPAFSSPADRPEDVISQSATHGVTEPVKIEVHSGITGYGVFQNSKFDRKGPPPQQRKFREPGCKVCLNVKDQVWQNWTNTQNVESPPRSVFLRLETSSLMQSVSSKHSGGITQSEEGMSSNGSGMHAALANMALNDPDTWSELQSELSEIIPLIRRLRHTVAKPHTPSELLFDTKFGASALTASEVSEGTLLVVGLLTALHAPDRPNLILLDDLDKGLHPKAQRELIGLLRRFLQRNPDLQILASTHSPYLLDCMEATEVRMTYLEQGTTVCAPLTRHPKYQTWKDEMHAGELWSLFGEAWLIDQPAVTTGSVGTETR